MKIVWSVLFIASSLWAFDKDTAEIIQSYRIQDTQKTRELIESHLKNKAFWLSLLDERDTDYGYFEEYEHLFVANKSAPNLALFSISKQGKLTNIKQTTALVGSGSGNKVKQGDLTTPIGVYDFTAKRVNLPPYYGPLAFTTDYPNAYDKSLKKTGYGIWIHGLPLDGNREELNTKGCIAIENPILSEYGNIVDYKKALLITYENSFTPASKEQLANILAGLYQWREAWIKNDLASYIAFYSPQFLRIDGMGYKAFASYKQQIFDKKEDKTIHFSSISVVPYPNQDGQIMFRIRFHQDYKAYKNGKHSYASYGYKVLYVEYKNGKMQILNEH